MSFKNTPKSLLIGMWNSLKKNICTCMYNNQLGGNMNITEVYVA